MLPYGGTRALNTATPILVTGAAGRVGGVGRTSHIATPVCKCANPDASLPGTKE